MTTEYTKNFGLALPDFRSGPWHDLLNGDITKIDQIIFGSLSKTGTPQWENDTDYPVGFSVIDPDTSTTWMALVEHTSPTTGSFSDFRSANPGYWTQLLAGFAPRGEWANNTDYFPYDLAYQTSHGVFALCKTRHTSNPSGSILDDEEFWSFLVNFSDIDLATAAVVTYIPAPGLTATNVQSALDQVEGQIHSLNDVNVSQGTDIGNLQNKDVDLQNQITANNAACLKTAGNQNITGGFSVTSLNLGNLASFTVNPLLGNYQYGNNAGPFLITAPTVDGGVDLLITNASGAGAVTFSGFTVNAANIGDPITTTNGSRFLVSIRRIGGISTYLVKALQ